MKFPQYETLALDLTRAPVLTVTLNRPEALNALGPILVRRCLNTQMGRDLLDLWLRLTADGADWRCVILTGAGDRALYEKRSANFVGR